MGQKQKEKLHELTKRQEHNQQENTQQIKPIAKELKNY